MSPIVSILLLAHSTYCATSVERIPLTFALPGFEAKGELTCPKKVMSRLPTVVLIPGSDVADMDYNVADGDRVVSHNLKDIALFLSARGYAVVRYNKRFVDAYDHYDEARFAKLTLQDLLADAQAVLRRTKELSRVDPTRLFVYGWSEGSALAGQIAISEPNLSGVVFQGSVARSFSANLAGLYARTGEPYLKRYAVGGKLSAPRIQDAVVGNGGIPSRMFARFLLDPQSQPGQPRVANYIDFDHDGMIDLETEAKPTFGRWFSDASLGIYSDANALPGLIAIAPKIKRPVLILQGERDGNTPVEGARELFNALATDRTIKVYRGLGHSLGPTRSTPNDRFLPIDAKPLKDLARWLDAHGGAVAFPAIDGSSGTRRYPLPIPAKCQ